MKKSHIAHDEVTIQMLRKDPDFAAEYLKAAMDDTEEPRVLLIALRRLAEAKGGLAKVAKKPESNKQACLARSRRAAIQSFRYWPPSSKRWTSR